MRFNLDSFNISPFTIIGAGDYSKLAWYQCSSWSLDENHGGVISTTLLTGAKHEIFPKITREQNKSGYSIYRKIFMKNEGDGGVGPFKLAFSSPASSVSGRMLIGISSTGTNSDTMADKPNDSTFDVMTPALSLEAGASIPLWIRFSIAADGTDYPAKYLVETRIEVAE